MYYTPSDIDILARTIYGEARGLYAKTNGGLMALISVANVVVNRVRARTWFGHTLTDVCLKPFQFSCWNQGDPNRHVIENVHESNSLFNLCMNVGRHVAEETWPDITKGSNHYYACWLPRVPLWAMHRKPLVQISDHLFFNLGAQSCP